MKPDFTYKSHIVEIKKYQKRENSSFVEQTKEKVIQDRKLAIESQIMRFMKKEKKMNHSSLVGQVISYLNLPLTGKDLQGCIDDLIRKDYIKRNETYYDVYEYMA